MPKPTIDNSTPLVPWTGGAIITTTATNENLLSNTAASGHTLEVVYLACVSADASNATTATASIYDQDGVGMNDDTGAYKQTDSGDTVDGAQRHLIAPIATPIAAAAGQVFATKYEPIYLEEDSSIVVQNGAGNDAHWTVTYRVLG